MEIEFNTRENSSPQLLTTLPYLEEIYDFETEQLDELLMGVNNHL